MRLEASHIGVKLAPEIKAANTNNLQAAIYLAKGARGMCTLNGWKKAGVVNGAQGTVYDIIHGEGQGPPHMSVEILVRFKTVREGGIYRDHSYVVLLDCKWTRFPLDLAYSTTSHKSKGLIFPLMSTREKVHSHSTVVFCQTVIETPSPGWSQTWSMANLVIYCGIIVEVRKALGATFACTKI